MVGTSGKETRFQPGYKKMAGDVCTGKTPALLMVKEQVMVYDPDCPLDVFVAVICNRQE